MEFKIKKTTTPAEALKEMGFSFEDTQIDRRGKKHVLYSKGNTLYEFKGCDIRPSDHNVIKLEVFE